jgi:hypothetical protein
MRHNSDHRMRLKGKLAENRDVTTPKLSQKDVQNYSTSRNLQLLLKRDQHHHQGLRISNSPTLELFVMALVSTSVERVKKDLSLHLCWMRALAMPWLLYHTFTVVEGSRACCDPKVLVFSLLEKLWVSSAPTVVMLTLFTKWW